MLMFCDQTVLWKCCDSTIDEAGNRRYHKDTAHDNILGGPGRISQLENYLRIISDYNSRNFTQPADVRVAFEGFINAVVERAGAGDCF